MGFREQEEPFEEVEIGTITDKKTGKKTPNIQRLRGLGFEDICRLARDHAPLLAVIYKRFMDEKAVGFTAEGLGALISAGMAEFPQAAAFIIGLAADDTSPETLDNIRRTRLTVQMECMQKIIGLTFISESEIKKLVEIVTEMMAATSSAMAVLTLPEPSGSGNGAFVSK